MNGDTTEPPGGPPPDPTLLAGAASEPPRTASDLRRVARTDYVRGPEIARGGMGRIVAARDVRHDRPVALKELLQQTPALIARFQREAMIAARLQHPAIVPIYEAGAWEDGEPFFAMKRIEGRALDAIIAERPALRDRLALLPNVIAVTEALAYAHARGVIHRDLKPHNVLVGDYGETVVIDWGLAKDLGTSGAGEDALVSTLPAEESSASPSGQLTVAGQALGTPAYMPPEQARGDEVDVRADVYSLGAILYHLLAGRVPHAEAGVRGKALLEHIEKAAPTPLAELVPDLAADLLTIVAKAMARTAGDRYRDAGEMAADLRRFAAGQLVSAHSYTMGALLARWARRHRVLLGAGAVLVIAAITGLFLYVRGVGAEEAIARRERHRADQLRTTAEQNLEKSRAQTMMLLEEQGRARLAVGQPLQALAFLSKSYSMGNASTSLRYLLARAMPATSGLALDVPGPSYSASFSSDDSRIVVRSDDAIWLVDASDGQRIVDLDDGERIFVGGVAIAERSPTAILGWVESGRVSIVDLSDGHTAMRLDPLPHIKHVAISASADVAAISTYEQVLRLSDPRTGRTRWSLTVAEVEPELHLGADGRYVMTCDDGGMYAEVNDGIGCTVRRAADGAVLLTTPPASCTFTPSGEAVVIAPKEGDAVIHDLTTGRRVTLETSARLGAVALSARGDRLVAIAEGTTNVSVWDPRSGAKIRTLSNATARGGEAAFDPTGRRLVVAGSDLTLRVWDLDRGLVLGELRGAGGRTVDIASDGQRIVTSHGRTAHVWRIDELSRSVTIEYPALVRVGLDFSPDGAHLASAASDGVRIWDARSGAPERAVTSTAAASLSYAPDGATLAVASGRDALLVDVRSGEVKRTISTTHGQVAHVRWAQQDRLLTVALAVQLWDARDGKLLVSVPDRHTGALSADGNVMATGGDQVVIRDASTGAIKASLPEKRTSLLALSGDGSMALTEGPRLYRVGDGLPPFQFEETSRSLGGGITIDGSLVAISHSEIKIFDGRSGRLLEALDGNDGQSIGLAFRPDGGAVAAAYEGGRIRIWDLALETRSPEQIAAIVAQHVPWQVDETGRLVKSPTSKTVMAP